MKNLVLRITLIFAFVGYFVAVGLMLAPANWHLTSSLVYSICPPAIVTITVDPSWMAMLIVIGPANALIYGILGLAIGVLSSQFHSGRDKILATSSTAQQNPELVTNKPRI